MTTKPVRFQGERLLLNYVVRSEGNLIVEALDVTGKVIGTSKPLHGDVIDAPVAWATDPKFRQGVVQLRFTLKNADLFSLRFD